MSAPERWIVIPRWDEFQHRDMARSTIPPWIKNLTRLLSDDDYLRLSMTQRGLLHGIWLLYAKHRRVLNEASSRRLLVSNKGEARHFLSNLDALNRAGFITFSASKPARHVASLEVEVEREVERGLSTRYESSPPYPPSNAYADELARLAADQTSQNGHSDRPPIDEPYFAHLLQAVGDTEENFAKLRRAGRGKPAAAIIVAYEAATAPTARDRLAVALTVLSEYEAAT